MPVSLFWSNMGIVLFMLLLRWWCFYIVTTSGTSLGVSAQTPRLKGEVKAVYDLLDRILPSGGKDHFVLQFSTSRSNDTAYFKLKDRDDGRIVITATSSSELGAGVGHYLRYYCNMTFGWPRGGGSHSFVPTKWPSVGSKAIIRHRAVPWSYLMNVCTHSYSLVWYSWKDWEQFIDWLSLSGINNILALTGQEEIQYKVFSELGLSDIHIRSWFNGPAFLTWSRGQNEYGSNICGPLPRSWMKDQWKMQKNQILPRLRSLGITGQLPGFQGNVPIQLKTKFKDANITEQGGTGWMDSLDPLYSKIADLWMKILIEDFGTDHWYQMDGYFNGGTAPWLTSLSSPPLSLRGHNQEYNIGVEPFPDHDESWFQRGVAAYTGLNRTDSNAIWSFQGFSFVSWDNPKQAKYIKGFFDSAPAGKFVVIDMSYSPSAGEWTKWNNASFFGTSFIWTALPNFGGTDGMKGDLSRLNNAIPFAKNAHATSVIGSGATPEGIDQNIVYYEFLYDRTFRDSPVVDIHQYIIERSHRRYGLKDKNANVEKVWSLLVDSVYSHDFSVQDQTAVAHIVTDSSRSLFENNRYTPKTMMCKIFEAWENLITADVERNEPFLYDLVNLGREVLAQITVPASLNFSDATSSDIMNSSRIIESGRFYMDLLKDIDTLVATDKAFLLGSWLDSARQWGSSSTDCKSSILGDDGNCEHFYEWNARTQLTTWNPTPKGAMTIPGGPIDYAAKHWSGLIQDYYAKRADLLLRQAVTDQSNGQPLNKTKIDRIFARHAYEWTTATNPYPNATIGDALIISRAMHIKYRTWFSPCRTNFGINGFQPQIWRKTSFRKTEGNKNNFES